MDKRGTHVGMIISFVIFITFIVFLYIVVEPAVKTGEDKKAILEYLEMRIIRNISINFTSTSVEISSNKNPQKDCVRLENFLILSEILAHMIVKNETGGIQDEIFRDFGNLGIKRKKRENLFFKIYSSSEFDLLGEGEITQCFLVEDEDYSIGMIKIERYIFESKVHEFIEGYTNNYENFKEDLKLPPGNEFGFGFIQSDGTKIEVGEGGSASVYAEEIPIQYIDNDANTHSGFINIKVW